MKDLKNPRKIVILLIAAVCIIVIASIFVYTFYFAGTDPRIDKTKAACTGYSSNTILKEYGNWSKKIYYDHDSWNAICPQETIFDTYGASNGGPITGAGFDSCLGGISLWWDPDIPVNETVMDEIYLLFYDRAKENGMEEPYLTFIPGKLTLD